MKVLFIVDSFPNVFKPNWSVFFKELALAINTNIDDIELSVISPSFYSWKEKAPKHCFAYRKSNIDGIDIYEKGSLNVTGRITIYRRYKIDKVVDFLYKKYLQDHSKPDIIHAHVGLWAGKGAQTLSNKINVPFIITEHSSRVFGTRYNNSQRKILQSIYDDASKVITVSKALKNHINQEFNIDAIEVVPNVVDTDCFTIGNNQKEHDTFTIISIGNLKSSKRFDLLIEAFSIVIERYPKIQLKIIGEGGEKKKLQNLINSKDLSDSVALLGEVLHEKIPQYFLDSDLFVLPSDIETFGVVFIEALASGIPVIGTKCGGPEDIINSENGILIEKDNKTILADAIVSIMNNYDQYDLDAIAEKTKLKYSPEKIAERQMDIYLTTINSYNGNQT